MGDSAHTHKMTYRGGNNRCLLSVQYYFSNFPLVCQSLRDSGMRTCMHSSYHVTENRSEERCLNDSDQVLIESRDANDDFDHISERGVDKSSKDVARP